MFNLWHFSEYHMKSRSSHLEQTLIVKFGKLCKWRNFIIKLVKYIIVNQNCNLEQSDY